jgi:hypothetical protein
MTDGSDWTDWEKRLLLDGNPWFHEFTHFKVGSCYSTVFVEEEGSFPDRRLFIPPGAIELYLGQFVKTGPGLEDYFDSIGHTFYKFDENGNRFEHQIFVVLGDRTRFREVPCRDKLRAREAAIEALSSHKTKKTTVDVLGNEFLNREIQGYLGGNDSDDEIKYKAKYSKYKNKYMMLKSKI